MTPARLSRRGALAAGFAAALPFRAYGEAAKLRIGVLRLASSAPVFIAQDLGYFRDAGLAVELIFFDAAQPIAVAAASGDIDIGVTGITAGLYNLAGKGAVALIAGQSREVKGFPLEAYLATAEPAGASLKAPRDIKGHTLGITQIGSSFHYAAGLIAEKYGFTLADLKFVPLQSMGNIVSALKGGRVEAAILPATAADTAIDGGGARLLGWGGDEVTWQVGAAFMSKRTSATKATLDAFMTAYRRGCAAAHEVLVPSVENGVAKLDDKTGPLLESIARNCNQPVERIRKGLAWIDRDGKLDTADIARQIGWYQAQDFVDKGFSLDAVIDKSFVSAT